MWAVFALLSLAALRPYVEASAKSPEAVEAAMTYGTIVCVGSLGMFLESNWTKVDVYKRQLQHRPALRHHGRF